MPQWIVTLNTGRFGDWLVIEADDEESAQKKIPRHRRQKVSSVRVFTPTRLFCAGLAPGDFHPIPAKTKRKER
jgi:hypothetical protein